MPLTKNKLVALCRYTFSQKIGISSFPKGLDFYMYNAVQWCAVCVYVYRLRLCIYICMIMYVHEHDVWIYSHLYVYDMYIRSIIRYKHRHAIRALAFLLCVGTCWTCRPWDVHPSRAHCRGAHSWLEANACCQGLWAYLILWKKIILGLYTWFIGFWHIRPVNSCTVCRTYYISPANLRLIDAVDVNGSGPEQACGHHWWQHKATIRNHGFRLYGSYAQIWSNNMK